VENKKELILWLDSTEYIDQWFAAEAQLGHLLTALAEVHPVTLYITSSHQDREDCQWGISLDRLKNNGISIARVSILPKVDRIDLALTSSKRPASSESISRASAQLYYDRALPFDASKKGLTILAREELLSDDSKYFLHWQFLYRLIASNMMLPELIEESAKDALIRVLLQEIDMTKVCDTPHFIKALSDVCALSGDKKLNRELKQLLSELKFSEGVDYETRQFTKYLAVGNL